MRDTGKTTRQVATDTELPSMVSQRQTFTVSCDHPADLAQRLQAKQQVSTKRCAWCGFTYPVGDFEGYLTCGGCREKR